MTGLFDELRHLASLPGAQTMPTHKVITRELRELVPRGTLTRPRKYLSARERCLKEEEGMYKPILVWPVKLRPP